MSNLLNWEWRGKRSRVVAVLNPAWSIELMPGELGAAPPGIAWQGLRKLSAEAGDSVFEFSTAVVLAQLAVADSAAGARILRSLCDYAENTHSLDGIAGPFVAAYLSARRDGGATDVARAEAAWRALAPSLPPGLPVPVLATESDMDSVAVRNREALTLPPDLSTSDQGAQDLGRRLIRLATAVLGSVDRAAGPLPGAVLATALRPAHPASSMTARRAQAVALAIAQGKAIAVDVQVYGTTTDLLWTPVPGADQAWRAGVQRVSSFVATGGGLDGQLVQQGGGTVHVQGVPKLSGGRVRSRGLLTPLLGPLPTGAEGGRRDNPGVRQGTSETTGSPWTGEIRSQAVRVPTEFPMMSLHDTLRWRIEHPLWALIGPGGNGGRGYAPGR
jgi:hypothetical protein